jgi:4-hydroxy-3-methylbut-2-enyl diphosphate reductase
MEVRLARKMGFCRGVQRAIRMAEGALAAGKAPVCSLGEIIHNPRVVGELSAKGLKVIQDPDEATGTVLIRSHGEPPEVHERLARRGVEVLDATCVLVRRAQQVVAGLAREGYRVVVIGEAQHPEVRAIRGYAPDVVCLDSPEELDRLPAPLGPGEESPARVRLGIVCQTTRSVEYFGQMVGRIVARGYSEVKVVNTVCGEVRARQDAAVELAGQVEVIFVLGGRQSANTRELARLCRAGGAPTHHLEDWRDFRKEMVGGRKVAGVTAGASTPRGVVEEFVERLRAFEPEG